MTASDPGWKWCDERQMVRDPAASFTWKSGGLTLRYDPVEARAPWQASMSESTVGDSTAWGALRGLYILAQEKAAMVVADIGEIERVIFNAPESP